MVLVSAPDLKHYFRENILDAMASCHVQTDPSTEAYIVNMLGDFATGKRGLELSVPLVHRWAEAQELPGTSRITALAQLGDITLYMSGFFQDHIEHKGLSQSYVKEMGERAYHTAGQLAATGFSQADASRYHVYEELAEKFDALTVVLDDVRERTVLRTPQDIVRLYEKWKKTRSPLIAKRLMSEGVFPQVEASLASEKPPASHD